jgi:hypothetical protein
MAALDHCVSRRTRRSCSRRASNRSVSRCSTPRQNAEIQKAARSGSWGSSADRGEPRVEDDVVVRRERGALPDADERGRHVRCTFRGRPRASTTNPNRMERRNASCRRIASSSFRPAAAICSGELPSRTGHLRSHSQARGGPTVRASHYGADPSRPSFGRRSWQTRTPSKEGRMNPQPFTTCVGSSASRRDQGPRPRAPLRIRVPAPR